MQFTAVIVRLHLFTIVPLAASVIQSPASLIPGKSCHSICSDIRCVRWPKVDADRRFEYLQ